MKSATDTSPTIVTVTLAAALEVLPQLRTFYGGLDLPSTRADGRLGFAIGGCTLSFAPAPDGSRPFYHFALLVADARFEAARVWLSRHAELLPDPDTGETLFEFDFWDARACYVHDPAGNILELIAHADVAASAGSGEFRSAELLGVSEVGLVTSDPSAAARTLHDELGLGLWSGAVPDGPGGLGFFGRKAHTLILSGVDRPWLPTGRPAESHPVDVTLNGAPTQSATLPGAAITVRRAP
jgi:catechol-2,3-dioxygenase